jgi:ABC-type glycerol-3-phosphate transport system substrate-binding protein
MSAAPTKRSAPWAVEMDRRQFLRRSGTAAVALGASGLLAACSGGSPKSSSTASSQDRTPVKITVWDYYGSSTPVKPALAGFKQRYPWITINYQGLDWDTISTKFTVSVSSGSAPDMATLDMTWIPTYASNGLLMDLSKVAGDTLNGKPIKDQYSGGALNAMTYQGHFVTMLFDADCYALYYRRDLFEKKGISVPTNWDEFRAAAKALATDTNGDGKADKYLMELDPDVFHYAAYLFQNGGAILDPANSKAVFNSPEGVRALEMYKGFLDDGAGIYWGPGQGDRVAGLKDGTVAMFEDGPYYMGIMKDGAPEMRGKWAIATAPYSAKPGSYLGGTGLSIPVNAAHPEAAWTLIQYLLEPQNSIGVAKYSGAAPGLQAALESPEVDKPDPYFGGQDVWKVWLPTLASATHYPYVKHWNDIDTAIADGVSAALLGKKTPQQALDDAAAQVDSKLTS